MSRIAHGNRHRLLAIAILLGTFSGLTPARAELTIDVTRGKIEPMPIAIPDFQGQSSGGQVGGQISRVVSADLERSGLFRPLNARALVQDPAALAPVPRFADWKLTNAQALVSGDVSAQPDGRLKVQFRLWDVLAGQQLTGVAYTATPQDWRRIAHVIADAIYKRITGEDGYFDTRVVYVAESGPPQRRVKRLALMDQDGFNHRFLTDGRALVLTPRFSPNAQEIAYLSYATGAPQVFLYNVDTGKQEALGRFPGMTFAPRFSPDGTQVVFSLSSGGGSQIYTQDLRTRKVTEITPKAGTVIDTTPTYSPVGKQIAFASDRGGTQQLYVMNADGSDVHRVSFGTGRYATPVWSPRGDLIAFTRYGAGDNFSVGVSQPDGQGERLLASGFLVEGPTWAPNGRVLMYYKQSGTDTSGRGSARLYSIDLTGANEREVATPQDGSDPAWSATIQRGLEEVATDRPPSSSANIELDSRDRSRHGY